MVRRPRRGGVGTRSVRWGFPSSPFGRYNPIQCSRCHRRVDRTCRSSHSLWSRLPTSGSASNHDSAESLVGRSAPARLNLIVVWDTHFAGKSSSASVCVLSIDVGGVYTPVVDHTRGVGGTFNRIANNTLNDSYLFYKITEQGTF